MSKLLHNNDDDDADNADAKAIAIPRFFSENSRAENAGHSQFSLSEGHLIIGDGLLLYHLQTFSI